MIRTAAVVCALTMCVLVPAGLHRLGAGPDEIAALARPGAGQVFIGDATVDVTVDRSIVKAGDEVTITLRATSEHTHKVKVAVIVHEERGSEGGRVSLPPHEVDYETVTLEAAPGGGPERHLEVQLRGYVGTEMDGMAAFGRYSVLAMAPAAAKNLRKQRRKFASALERAGDAMNVDSSGYWEALQPEQGMSDGDLVIARVDINTYKASPKLRIEVPASAAEGDTFVANLVISNPSKKAMQGVRVEVSQPWLDADQVFGGDDVEFRLAEVPGETELNAQAETVVPVEITVYATGTLGLFAQVYDSEGYTYATALDGVTITPIDPADREPVTENPWGDREVGVTVAEVH